MQIKCSYQKVTLLNILEERNDCFFKKIKKWYDEVTWKKATRRYCEKLKNAKMRLSDR